VKASDIRLLIFPGIGEDHRMAYAQLSLPFRVLAVDYIAPRKGDTMGSYARRLGEQLLRSGVIDDTKPLIFAGTSFGGVIAQELSNAIRCDGVVMISSYRHERELSRFVRWLGEKVAPRLPIVFYHLFRLVSAPIIRTFAKLSLHDTMLCARMYGRFNKRWFRQHCVMAATWQGCDVTVPLLRIHGDKDIVIPNYNRSGVDTLLAKDMHMSSLSRRREVNRAIEAFIRRIMPVDK
jgi:pimeloyl-ACP methyl ester carboxylesterase